MCGFLSVSFKVQNQTSYVVCRREFSQKAIFMSKLDIFYIYFVSKFCYSITMSCPTLSSSGQKKSLSKSIVNFKAQYVRLMSCPSLSS